jgi:hypothetical protein
MFNLNKENIKTETNLQLYTDMLRKFILIFNNLVKSVDFLNRANVQLHQADVMKYIVFLCYKYIYKRARAHTDTDIYANVTSADYYL